MTELSLAAQKVKEALAAKNLETPSCRLAMENSERKAKIEAHFREIMKLMELDLHDEIFSGLNYHNFPKITLIENKMQVDEMITVRDITLTSVCEHHFVTIDGKATVSYIPKDKVIGLSKINRIVQFFSQRPQVQERLTQQILVALQTLLGTVNVAVSIDATHFCVKARGIKDSNSLTTTTALGGGFKTNPSTRQEFLRALKHY